ncbi:hypothetical protein ALI144C_15605 [Actinosynnema sp. ALI-1.44]|uniref:Imm1 family immunity protein n=1 Tax=Actinosynnema sp. ALI-1.44 TaxID=1933779 RepID=UPI00097CBE3D|nr:Imm1 family immunity protein [Actinosynnema sp. ALI-1.44]ONI84119.1 hypothetical protein ALI144C_15605 [Actinosynnema sp. ALI-1.44]
MVELKLLWDHQHGDKPVIASTLADLTRVLDEVTAQAAAEGARLIVQAIPDLGPSAPLLDIGLAGERGAMYYAGDECPDGCFSSGGAPSNTGTVLYYFMTADTEYPPGSELPMAAIRQAAGEFMATGARPSSIDWQPVPELEPVDGTPWWEQ